MKRTIYLLVGCAIGSCVVGYLRSSGIFVVVLSNAVVWLLTGCYWLGCWQGELEMKEKRDGWRRNWFYEI